MTSKKERILAIDPGTRHMGVALLDGGDLIYRDVKTIQKQKTPHDTLRECRKVVLRLIKDLKPSVVVIEKTFFANNRNSALVNVLYDDIRAIAKRRGLKVISFAPSTVKKTITGNGRASKADVARIIVLRYPELKVFLTQDRDWKERFHQNMFDAVALGILAESRR